MMDDMMLVFGVPFAIFCAVAVIKVFEELIVDCRHDYDEWQSWTTEHAYVQQKQCKKCKYIFTYQERKMTKLEEKNT